VEVWAAGKKVAAWIPPTLELLLLLLLFCGLQHDRLVESWVCNGIWGVGAIQERCMRHQEGCCLRVVHAVRGRRHGSRVHVRDRGRKVPGYESACIAEVQGVDRRRE
jgi:hypothetical protein